VPGTFCFPRSATARRIRGSGNRSPSLATPDSGNRNRCQALSAFGRGSPASRGVRFERPRASPRVVQRAAERHEIEENGNETDATTEKTIRCQPLRPILDGTGRSIRVEDTLTTWYAEELTRLGLSIRQRSGRWPGGTSKMLDGNWMALGGPNQEIMILVRSQITDSGPFPTAR
jgi:hypothetical protein